jgi:hypothetical protein
MEDQLGKALASRLNKQQMEKMLYLNEYFQLGPLLNLARERPLLISGLVETYWRTRAEPVLDYVPDLWMRIDLFRRLQDNIKRHELSFVPSMTVFALFMVAQLTCCDPDLIIWRETLKRRTRLRSKSLLSSAVTLLL